MTEPIENQEKTVPPTLVIYETMSSKGCGWAWKLVAGEQVIAESAGVFGHQTDAESNGLQHIHSKTEWNTVFISAGSKSRLVSCESSA